MIVCDEAHKLSATFFGGEVKYTKRYKLGQLLSSIARHFLLMTATPHNGKEEDFQLFMALLDGDRFEGKFRDGVHTQDVSDLMRRMVKESLLKFDGKPLFPERIANTVPYKLSEGEATLYKDVTDYVRQEFNRAEALQNDKRAGTVGFALTILQRRLASSPEAIYQSLRRRRERLERRLREVELMHRAAVIQGSIDGPELDEDDVDDLEDAPENELEEAEHEVLDQATAARTIEELRAEIGTLQTLENAAHIVRRSGDDRKWSELRRLLDDIFKPGTTGEKLVIFTEQRDTLNYLQARISTTLGRSEAVVCIHGGMGREERMKAQEAFKHDPVVQILVATDAAGEGINLQRAHLMVNYDLPWKAMELLREGLQPFVEREMQAQHAQRWFDEVKQAVHEHQANLFDKHGKPKWDAASLLAVMANQWEVVFRKTLGRAERTLVHELRDVRNKWAHQDPFSSDDAYRALDSVARLLGAVSAPQAADVEKLKMELLRLRFDEQLRSEKRKTAGTAIESQVTGTLRPWREVVSPHKDVATGRYQQAEFAADLWQVHIGEGTDEYLNPVEFFRRTFLTESLKQLLVGAARRLAGEGGDPVVQLQTNFGGGKTHSMLALYHLFSGAKPSELVGVDAVLEAAGTPKLAVTKRVVLVGNKISPGNPSTKPDGTVVRTLWGELVYQLGGKKAFARVKKDDEKATSPGDVLRELLNEYGPSLILIDEWVAYARQLHEQSDLPAGSFETQFTFAQALTESAKAAKQCLLVISLPASDTTGSPHTQADDVEVGGQRGREALDRLRNVVGRVESSWRPASAEEGFEIVRRRLFEPLVDKESFVARDTVAREFYDLYRAQATEFPADSRDPDYEKRLRAAYPIHPEVFDRLYNDWSTLVKFQRTRGVLRLMAAVIHSLWQKGDRNPLIMPGNISIDDPRVQFELTRYLSDNWVPVIEKDVDGPNALPLRIDGEVANLGKFAATRRVARTIYLGSAPTGQAANRGLEDRRIKLGCVMPGESAAVFGDALRRLSAAATYLYQDGQRYWYATQPTVTKLAEDRAEELKRNPDNVAHEIEERLRSDLQRERSDFKRIHVAPMSGQDVQDDMDVRLVVLGLAQPYSKDPDNPAEVLAKSILESRGNAPRLFRNALVFLAVDGVRLQDLDEATRRFLAWESILTEAEQLNLDPHQEKQANTQLANADSAVQARLPEAYQWLLVPTQSSPQATVVWQSIKLSGTDSLAKRASKKLLGTEQLIKEYAGTLLRLELDKIPLWRGDSVPIKQLVDDFARYLYLPRLQEPTVLLEAVRDGVGLMTWEKDSFAYADAFDEAAGRYRGLRGGQNIRVAVDSSALLVKPEVARAQMDSEQQQPPPPPPDPREKGGPHGTQKPTRFHGSVRLDPSRAGVSASKIADEIISHLVGIDGADVTVTLEIEAEVRDGFPDKVVRTVTENSRTLKFTQQAFEKD